MYRETGTGSQIQGDMYSETGTGGPIQGVSNLVFHAQSTITVISGRYTICRYTISVKNMSMLKTYVYSDLF